MAKAKAKYKAGEQVRTKYTMSAAPPQFPTSICRDSLVTVEEVSLYSKSENRYAVRTACGQLRWVDESAIESNQEAMF